MKTKDAPAKSAPENPPLNRMVRVKNVCTRAIIEDGHAYQPGDVLELTPERVTAYRQRVQPVRESEIVNRKA